MAISSSIFTALQLVASKDRNAIAFLSLKVLLKSLCQLTQITAKTAGASKQYETEVDKPLGLTLGSKPGGGVVITVRFLARWNVWIAKVLYDS